MREHNREFCRAVAQALDVRGPVLEVGSLRVPGQEDLADLRPLFPGREYVGLDARSGPGVDRVGDAAALPWPDGAFGTVLALETFEHVFEIGEAFQEARRVLAPGGLFVLTMPLDFRIHAYPEDYWRMTPQALRRALEPYAARLVGRQGYAPFPHTVMAVAAKAPSPPDFAQRARHAQDLYRASLSSMRAAVPLAARLRAALKRLHRSREERRKLSEWSDTEFWLEPLEGGAGSGSSP